MVAFQDTASTGRHWRVDQRVATATSLMQSLISAGDDFRRKSLSICRQILSPSTFARKFKRADESELGSGISKVTRAASYPFW